MITVQQVDLSSVFTARSERQLGYVAVDDEDGPVGVAHISATDGYAILEHIYVAPEYRRSGVGGLIIATVRAELGPVSHDNRLSYAGSAFTKALRVHKLPSYPFQRLKRADSEQSGAMLLDVATIALNAR